MSAVVESLLQAKLLPGSESTTRLSRLDEAVPVDLLLELIPVWQTEADTSTDRKRRSRAARMISWLASQQANGACLTWGIPDIGDRASVRWLGARFAWWPHGIPEGRRVGLVSSRLGKKLESRDQWFRVLRASCAPLDPRHDRLVSASSTTTARFVERCAELFRLPLLCIETDDRATLARWAEKIRRMTPPAQQPIAPCVWLSPCLSEYEDSLLASREASERWIHDVPTRDRALCLMSEQLVVLHLRRQGNLDRLIRARLDDSTWPLASVRLALGEQLVSRRVARELMDRGAVGWFVSNPPPKTECGPVSAADSRESTASRGVDEAGESCFQPAGNREWSYLTHCTRRRDGPWPGQRKSEYVDDLILSREGTDHSAFAAIRRIVIQRRLIASSAAIRGGTAVVSFTAVPLEELRRLRVFRPHRTRWDFQPYGICIRRDWLEGRGARAVCYASDEQWSKMSVAERPFFQRDSSRGRRNAKPIDWTVEQEWRHVGDVSLVDLPSDAAFVFVPSPAEANQLGRISRWPVVVLPRDDEDRAMQGPPD